MEFELICGRDEQIWWILLSIPCYARHPASKKRVICGVRLKRPLQSLSLLHLNRG